MLLPVPDPVFALRLVLPAATGAWEAAPMPSLRPGQRLLIHAGGQPGVWNELGDLLQVDFASAPDAGPVILLELMPPLLLAQALHRHGFLLGIYLPAERHVAHPLLGSSLAPRAALDLLRKLHTLQLEPAVLADAAALTDPAHYADLVAPFAAHRFALQAGATEAQWQAWQHAIAA